MILKKIFWNGCFSKKITHGFSFLNKSPQKCGWPVLWMQTFFKKKNWILPIKDRANLEIMMLLGTDSIKTTLPWHHLVCSFCWRPKARVGCVRNGVGYLCPLTSRFWAWYVQSYFFIPERERWFLCTGSWKAMAALCESVTSACPPTSLFLLQGMAWIVSGSYSPSLL